MSHEAIRRVLTLFALAFGCATVAFAQSRTSPETVAIPIAGSNSWQHAVQAGSSKGKLVVVTLDQPRRRQTCRMQSYTPDELVCFRGNRGSRTYLRQDVLALILPGSGGKLLFVLGTSAELGVAIWGTVVLAATCPACAVATAFGTLVYVGAAWADFLSEYQPDRLLYLAPGQKLSRKLGYVKS
jgi:hypothetical protein